MLRIVMILGVMAGFCAESWAQDAPEEVDFSDVIAEQPESEPESVNPSSTTFVDVLTTWANGKGKTLIIETEISLPDGTVVIGTENMMDLLNYAAKRSNAVVDKQGSLIIVRAMDTKEQEKKAVMNSYAVIRPDAKKVRKDGSVGERWLRDIYVRPFMPKTRYYIDSGTDDDGEIDIFKDGNLGPTLDFVNLYYPLNVSKRIPFFGEDWLFGPSIGLGITAPADADVDEGKNDSDDGSDAPVIMLSGALELDIPVGQQKVDGRPVDRNYISIEVGVAQGWSLDESIDNNDDFGVLVGLGYSWKQDRFTIGGDE